MEFTTISEDDSIVATFIGSDLHTCTVTLRTVRVNGDLVGQISCTTNCVGCIGEWKFGRHWRLLGTLSAMVRDNKPYLGGGRRWRTKAANQADGFCPPASLNRAFRKLPGPRMAPQP